MGFARARPGFAAGGSWPSLDSRGAIRDLGSLYPMPAVGRDLYFDGIELKSDDQFDCWAGPFGKESKQMGKYMAVHSGDLYRTTIIR
jgi:hypothetical protein